MLDIDRNTLTYKTKEQLEEVKRDEILIKIEKMAIKYEKTEQEKKEILWECIKEYACEKNKEKSKNSGK